MTAEPKANCYSVGDAQAIDADTLKRIRKDADAGCVSVHMTPYPDANAWVFFPVKPDCPAYGCECREIKIPISATLVDYARDSVSGRASGRASGRVDEYRVNFSQYDIEQSRTIRRLLRPGDTISMHFVASAISYTRDIGLHFDEAIMTIRREYVIVARFLFAANVTDQSYRPIKHVTNVPGRD